MQGRIKGHIPTSSKSRKTMCLYKWAYIKKKWMEENFYYSRDIQHKILNDILKMPPNVNVRTFGIKRSTLIILFLIFFNFFFSLGPKKIKTLKKIHKVLLRYKKDDI